MLLKTILNQLEKYSSFVFTNVFFTKSYHHYEFEDDTVIVEIEPRKNGITICSGCGKQGKVYDKLDLRLFQYVPIWIFAVYFAYTMRRVNCKTCGVTVEMVPWAEGKEQLTRTFKWFLSQWAKKLSWEDVARTFNTSWDSVHRSVKTAVEWGLKNRCLENITAIGIDEISRKKGHVYATLVYQIDNGCKRLLWIGNGRKKCTLDLFFKWFGKEKSKKLKAICTDMWKPFIDSIQKYASQAVHVLDRFHIMQHMGKAIDKVRAEESKKLHRDGYEPVLKKSRYAFLKRPTNLTEKQKLKLNDLLQYNLKSVKAYLMKEHFQTFWTYKYKACAKKFLTNWTAMVMRSRIEPMKEVARMIRGHEDLILNWFDMAGKVSNGIAEGLNGKAKVTIRKSYGFRSYKIMEIALYHTLGELPMPKDIHKFC